jgi:hypothetical protein
MTLGDAYIEICLYIFLHFKNPKIKNFQMFSKISKFLEFSQLTKNLKFPQFTHFFQPPKEYKFPSIFTIHKNTKFSSIF